MSEVDKLVIENFSGRIVRKDLTKLIKQGYNVPVYVLEYLLGMYCSSDDEAAIEEGIKTVKNILAQNYVRPDEAEKVKSKIKEKGVYKVIDKVSVKLNEKLDCYQATFSNLGIKNVEIDKNYVKQYEKLLAGGIWSIVTLSYYYDEAVVGMSPFIINDLKPIQMANMDINEVFEGRKAFTKDQWLDAILRSSGMEPTQFKPSEKWHLLARLIPLIENNYNVCELGPRGTGKSFIYEQISPFSILVSGGQTTVANLFYNMSRREVGLVGYWDTVAFDEVAGINFKDQDGIQIMKGFMANGIFSRGRDEITANASMVFVGNINQSVETVVKTSHLFSPFPDEMSNDTAFFDRMHFYIPGWEIPKMRPEYFTNQFGLIVDYLAEFIREMRKYSYTDAFDKYFKLGNHLQQRDVTAVRKTVSGLVKLLHPNGEFNKEDVREILEYALIGRRRVKEQLKKMGGMEFHQVQFSYIDNKTLEEKFVSVPEMGGGKLIPEGTNNPGHVYTVAKTSDGRIGIYKLELQVTSGSGKFNLSGFGSGSKVKETAKMAFDFFRANAKNISAGIKVGDSDFHLHMHDLQGIGSPENLSLASFITLCSGTMGMPIQEQMVILGSFSIGGTMNKVDEFANTLQVCLDAGGKRVLIPMASAADISTVPTDLFTKFQTTFYQDPQDSVFKALGVM